MRDESGQRQAPAGAGTAGQPARADLSRLSIGKTAQPFRRGSRRKLVVIVLLILALGVAALFLTGVFNPAIPVHLVSVSKVFPSQSFTVLNASGYVVAQTKASVASKITGLLVKLNVEEGHKVREGQVLAVLENADYRATLARVEAAQAAARFALRQAEADLYNARLIYERNSRLVKRGVISQQEFDTSDARFRQVRAAVSAARAQIRVADAAVLEAKVNLDYTYIRAPFDAVVLTKNADIGDIITPIGAAQQAQASVVTIADMDSLMVEADVSESSIAKVKVGQPAEIQLDSLPDERFPGRVHMIVPTADRSKASVQVKVAFMERDPRVLPEMSAKAAFLSRAVRPDEREPVVAVPGTAVIEVDGRAAVFVAQDDRARLTSIETGRTFGDLVEVRAGLSTEQRVILEPGKGLEDGAKIMPQEK
ncbi:RND family efflux transporter, MFP subunit [Desulfocurvibacter africanus PCS]|uniref:RND family efflux transporter, MFP subunit n=1 Tax=Desulfocurvibacter africanus PCS TaxID=1262666 RepID=M5PWN7_DESAF|nr:efflux RND transporter periplasmic adaptor subunit [Desulfocurvibacter africanus]EMG38395.1 RND family efflux transporter, MFP subunit [Desulfocurvibacter africanus PCS]